VFYPKCATFANFVKECWGVQGSLIKCKEKKTMDFQFYTVDRPLFSVGFD